MQRIKYTQRGVVTTDLLASLVAPPGVTNFQVLVASAIQNLAAQTVPETQATQALNMQFIAPTKSALLLYAEPEPGIMVPSAGYIFTWVGLLGAGAFGSRISPDPGAAARDRHDANGRRARVCREDRRQRSWACGTC